MDYLHQWRENTINVWNCKFKTIKQSIKIFVHIQLSSNYQVPISWYASPLEIQMFSCKSIISCENLNFPLNPLLMTRMASRFIVRTSLVSSISYISSIKIGWAVSEKIWFFLSSKFVYNFGKKNFFELILDVNSSCSGSHLPSQYGSNPSGSTQTMLILLRPCVSLLIQTLMM